MNTIAQIRRANLERLVIRLGTLEAVADKGQTSSIYLSQIRNMAVDTKTGRPREMGTAMARRLEVGTDKPSGWMDVDHAFEGPEPMHVISKAPGRVTAAQAAEALVHSEIIKAGNAAAHGDTSLSPLLAASAIFARYLLEADDMTRESVAPLLKRLTTTPEEAPRIARMIEALIEESRSANPPLQEPADIEAPGGTSVQPIGKSSRKKTDQASKLVPARTASKPKKRKLSE
jgi:hypothetical protein